MFDGAFALHQGGEDADVQARKTALDNLQNVAQDGAGSGGDDAQTTRANSARAVCVRCANKPSAREFLFQLLKSDLQRADALRLQRFDDELVFAARFIDFQIAAREDFHAVLRFEFYKTSVAFEQSAFQLAVGVFERKIKMATGGGAAVRDFAFHPNGAEVVFEERLDGGVEFADAIDAALKAESEGELSGIAAWWRHEMFAPFSFDYAD